MWQIKSVDARGEGAVSERPRTKGKRARMKERIWRMVDGGNMVER